MVLSKSFWKKVASGKGRVRPRRRRKRIPNGINLSKTAYQKLRYGELTPLAGPPAGDATVYNFSANGMFDPNISGGGHQPRIYDQMMTFYDHYAVTKSRITLRLSHDEQQPVSVAILLRDSPSSGTLSVQDILEYPKRKILQMSPDGGSVRTLSYSCDVGKFLGRKVMGDPELKGSAGTNPVEQVYFQVAIWKPDASAFAANIIAQVQIDYTSAFFEPKLGGSS